MLKRIFIGFIMLFVAGSGIFATGIGIQGGTDVAAGGKTGIDITFKLNSVPLIFTVGIPSFSPLAVGVTADYWVLNDNLVGPLNWYIGAGLFAQIYTDSDEHMDAGFFGGVRVPVGLNMFFADNMFEVYVQLAPGLGIGIGNGIHPDFIIPFNYGIRFWF